MTNKADQTCFLMLLFVSCPRYFLACLVTEQTTIQDLVSPKNIILLYLMTDAGTITTRNVASVLRKNN